MLLKCKNYLYRGVILILIGIAFSSWKIIDDKEDESIKLVQQCLTGYFDPSTDGGVLKKWELNLTDNGFFRLRKYYPNGKKEYFSFKLKRLQLVDYLGTEENGILLLRTNGNDIIVQTYNDPKGNIDSTSNTLKLPLKNMDAKQLNVLDEKLNLLKKRQY